MLIFYRGETMANLVSIVDQMTVLKQADQCLAILRAGTKTQILAVDRMSTPLPVGAAAENAPSPYTVYGHTAPGDLPSAFDGERRDPVTGLYGLGRGYRWYSSVMMRFLSPDSISPFGAGGLNAYGFVEGDPVNRNDPDGHTPNAGIVHLFPDLKPVKGVPLVHSFVNSEGYSYPNVHGVFSQDRNGMRSSISRSSGPMVVINYHGSLHGTIAVGDERMTPSQFVKYMQPHGGLMKYQRIALLSCYGGGSGFAQELSNLTGKAVYAPSGAIMTQKFMARQKRTAYTIAMFDKDSMPPSERATASEHLNYYLPKLPMLEIRKDYAPEK